MHMQAGQPNARRGLGLTRPGRHPRSARSEWRLMTESVGSRHRCHAGATHPRRRDTRPASWGWVEPGDSTPHVRRSRSRSHYQQAAEKLFKGFLVLRGVDFRKTHDLEELGRTVLTAFPDLTPMAVSMCAWTNWGLAYRYRDEPNPVPEPSAEELDAALALIARLADALSVSGRPRWAHPDRPARATWRGSHLSRVRGRESASGLRPGGRLAKRGG